MRRRDFFGVAAAIPGVAAAARIDVASIKPRGAKKVEIVYKSSHTRPNGLQATRGRSCGSWTRASPTIAR